MKKAMQDLWCPCCRKAVQKNESHHGPQFWKSWLRPTRAGLNKCGARFEALLRGPTEWRVQKFLRGSIKS